MSFKPIIPSYSKVLILGTMPSVKSLEDEFYYAHPRNAFWPIIGSFVGRELSTIEERIAACDELGILLWDVLQSCERQGSLDSAIQKPIANDFATLFKQHPNVKHVAFNGGAAEKLFKKEVIKKQLLPPDLQFITLPSSSSAYAAKSLEDKRLLWQEKLSDLL